LYAIKNGWAGIARFGGVVFWDCPEGLIRQIHEELKFLPGLSQLEEQARDFLKVKVGAAEDSVGSPRGSCSQEGAGG